MLSLPLGRFDPCPKLNGGELMRGFTRYAIRNPHGVIVVRALPTRKAAENLLGVYGGKVIVDPRSVGR